jgi:hypothetical protein
MQAVEYKLPVYGLGTDFSEFERPITFATTYTNRFRNITGGAERRPGAQRYLTQISAIPNLTRLHEHVSTTGTVSLMTSDDFGNIWRYNASGSPLLALTGKANQRQISAQAEDKLIFVNGTDRNFYTDDGGTTFNELRAIITKGTMAAGTSATRLIDSDISNWIGATLVSNNDIVYNVTVGAYGIVSTISSASLTHTPITNAADGAGNGFRAQQAGDVYQLVDYVDLNIIPAGNNSLDNVATATTGTTPNVVAVSGVNFANTQIRAGDIVYNTTRNAIAFVGTISANINYRQIPSNQSQIQLQTAGDALAFFKSAMPIASNIHVHYGRVYYLDSRDKTRIVISAPDDPEDVTTYQKTLDTTSYSFGTQQPTGDIILSMGTFQKYFVASGEKNLYIYDGITPIADTSTTTVDFKPIAFYPNGIATRFGIATNGSDLLHETKEGLQAINIGNISNTTVQNNASVPVRTAMLDAIAATTNTDNIQLSFYARRSWLINKIGDVCYILNTNPTYDDSGQLQIIASWHLYTGPWAQLNHYFVRRNGDLIGCGTNGLIYQLDASASTDDGQPIATSLTTAWLTLEEPQKTVRVKQGQYIKPVFESPNGIGYTINAVAGWDNFSSDSIVVSAVGAGQIGSAIVGTTPIGAGNFAQANKYPLRWRGEQARIQFTTNSSAAQDIITGFTLYGTIGGIR